MANTLHIGLTLVEQVQAQKEVIINQALMRMDALLNTGATSRVLDAPPGSPLAGDLYIVGNSPSGAWLGKALQIAYFEQLWRFIVPRAGMTLWVVGDLQACGDANTIYQVNRATFNSLVAANTAGADAVV
jgi:hypothetical protein